MGAPSATTLAVHQHMYKLAEAYGIPGHRVDGNDVLAVHDLMLELDEYVRAGNGPVFVEAQTYRLQGHSIADPANYRPADEVEYWRSRDPIPRFQQWLMAEGLASEEEIAQIDAGVDEEVVAAAEYADSSPFPEPQDLYKGVYLA